MPAVRTPSRRMSAERVRAEPVILFAHPAGPSRSGPLVALDLYPGLAGQRRPSRAARGAIAELEALPERRPRAAPDRRRAADAVDAPAARFAAAFVHLPRLDGRGPLDRLERPSGMQAIPPVRRPRRWPSCSPGRSCRRAGSAGGASSTAPARSGPSSPCPLGRAPPPRRRRALAGHATAAGGVGPPGGSGAVRPPRLLTGGEVARSCWVSPPGRRWGGPSDGAAGAGGRQGADAAGGGGAIAQGAGKRDWKEAEPTGLRAGAALPNTELCWLSGSLLRDGEARPRAAPLQYLR